MVKHKPEVWSRKGKDFVLIPYKVYEAMKEELEDAEDLRLLLESKRRQAGAPTISLEQMKRRVRMKARRGGKS
jgi:PHD/YefM family antitoxin component YafN of YafNO toxin-antitoxin module